MQELNLKFPFCDEHSVVKMEIIEQTPGCVIFKRIFDNGLELTFTQVADNITMSSNIPISIDQDGTVNLV